MLYQEESTQDIWLNNIAFIANGCTDYEQFRIAVEAFAMGEPTEDAEADMERAFNARNMSPGSSMPYDADESIDFFGDEEAEEFIVTSWAMARGTDNETVEEAKVPL